MTDLVDVYQRDELHRYEEILRANREALSDPFIAENMDEVTRNIRSRAMLRLVKPYQRFRLDFAAAKLGISVEEATEILCVLIIDGKFQAKIDQATGVVAVRNGHDQPRWRAIRGLSSAVEGLSHQVFRAGDGHRLDGPVPGLSSIL